MGLTQITTGGVDDNINIDSNTLKVDGTNNRVGIGTAAPGAKLSIAEQTYIDGGFIRFLSNASSQTGTAMWRPATDTLAFNTTSTERMRIDSSGNVGIGTTSPSGKLNIQGSDSQLLNLVQDSGDLAIRLNDAGVGSAYIKVRDNTGGSLSFDTGGSERMRITSAGLVGIGTSSAAATLHVAVDDPQFRLQRTGSYSTSAGPLIQFQGKGPNGTNYNFGKIQAVSSGSNNAGVLQFFTNSAGAQSERMRIDSSGAASFKGGTVLVEATSNTTNAQLSLGRPDSTSAGYIRYINNENAMAFRTNGSGEDMRIDSSGNVGIGETSPSTLLSLGKSLSTFKLKLYDNGDANDYGFGTQAGTLDYHSGGNHIFYKSGSEKMRIDSSGRLLVGTTTNQGGHLFQVKGGDASLTKLVAASGGNAVHMLRFRVHNANNTSQDASLAG